MELIRVVKRELKKIEHDQKKYNWRGAHNDTSNKITPYTRKNLYEMLF